MEGGAGPSTLASKFSSGEVRKETGGGLAYIAVAAAAPGATSVKVNIRMCPIIYQLDIL